MADIRTHLRELGVAFSFFNEKNLEDITPNYFYEVCYKNIEMSVVLEISMISDNPNVFNDKEVEIINNAMKLGTKIKEKFNIPNNPKIIWVGNNTQSDSPVDLIIDKYRFSLKEESFILENMGLYKLLNILLNTNKYLNGTHVFKEFAPDEFENWFNVTCNCLLKNNPNKFSIEKLGKYKAIGILENNKMLLKYNDSEYAQFNAVSSLSYKEFEFRANRHLREYVFSKWIKSIKDDIEYIEAKKMCAIKAGENILKLVKKYENTCPISLMRFFRIEKDRYYYAKTTSHSLEIYQVPSLEEACKNIVVKNIWIEVPKSQLNFYTKIVNLLNGSEIVFRNELRYSHGQFNGTPEAKCYIDKKNCDLTTMYKKVT